MSACAPADGRRQRDCHIRFTGSNPVYQRTQPSGVSFSTEHLDHRCSAVFMTQGAQCLDQNVNWRALRKTAVQNADMFFGRRTASGDERRKDQSRDEFPTSHSIKRSASPSNCDGTVTPSAFAVPRLMMKVNLVGCSIGRLPGWVPLRRLRRVCACPRNSGRTTSGRRIRRVPRKR